jgi:hypothetical protein
MECILTYFPNTFEMTEGCYATHLDHKNTGSCTEKALFYKSVRGTQFCQCLKVKSRHLVNNDLTLAINLRQIPGKFRFIHSVGRAFQ